MEKRWGRDNDVRRKEEEKTGRNKGPTESFMSRGSADHLLQVDGRWGEMDGNGLQIRNNTTKRGGEKRAKKN